MTHSRCCRPTHEPSLVTSPLDQHQLLATWRSRIWLICLAWPALFLSHLVGSDGQMSRWVGQLHRYCCSWVWVTMGDSWGWIWSKCAGQVQLRSLLGCYVGSPDNGAIVKQEFTHLPDIGSHHKDLCGLICGLWIDCCFLWLSFTLLLPFISNECKLLFQSQTTSTYSVMQNIRISLHVWMQRNLYVYLVNELFRFKNPGGKKRSRANLWCSISH